jgi:hypothetical protein
MINAILEAIGIFFIAMWLLGSANVIDFKLCISPAGTCSVEVRK